MNDSIQKLKEIVRNTFCDVQENKESGELSFVSKYISLSGGLDWVTFDDGKWRLTFLKDRNGLEVKKRKSLIDAMDEYSEFFSFRNVSMSWDYINGKVYLLFRES